MRVLQLITRAELGGSQRYVAELAKRQRECGFEVELASGTLGWLNDQRECFTRVHHIPDLVREIAPAHDSAALAHLLRFLRRRRYDVVHTHCSKAGFLGRIAAAAVGVPVVAHTSHGTILSESISTGRRALYWAAEQTAALVTHRLFAVSRTDQELLRRSLRTRASALRVMTIVPGYIRRMPAAWRLSEESRWDLVAIGNLYVNKAYDVLLPAVARVARAHPRLRLTIFGEGPERPALEAQLERLSLRPRVRMAGRIVDAASSLARAGAYVLPSRKEGLPLALLEAMATGAPIVATDVGAVREALGPSAPLARADDPDDLARRLDELLSSDAHRLALASAARASFERLLPADDPGVTPLMYA